MTKKRAPPPLFAPDPRVIKVDEAAAAVTPHHRLSELVFVRTVSGIGDSLNGLASSYLIARFLNASFTVCWPEVSSAVGAVRWGVRTLGASSGCVQRKREWEELMLARVLAASPNRRSPRRVRARQLVWEQMVVGDDWAMLRVDAPTNDVCVCCPAHA